MKYAAYIRVSDKNRGNGETQRADIEAYAKANKINISRWVEEHVSASKTDIEERQLMELVNAGYSIVMTDVTRLGRRKVFDLLAVIGQICRYGELRLTYTNRIINETNCDDAETIFTMVGGSFAAVDEAKKRSQTVGTDVRSKLDDHAAFIIKELKAGTQKTAILEKLEKQKSFKVSRAQLYRWIEKRVA